MRAPAILPQRLTLGVAAVPLTVLAYWGSRSVPLSVVWQLVLFGAAAAVLVGSVWVQTGRTAFRLRTVSNLLAALREGDVSFRLRQPASSDPFSEAFGELNALSDAIRHQRLDEVEATALLRTVLGQVDVAVFAFDAADRLRLVNLAGERLLGRPASDCFDQHAVDLGLAECLTGEPARTMPLQLPGGSGRWELRRGEYRHLGRPHRLLVLSDVSRALRAEELAAWKRLIRVIGHELNNSLAPITSLTTSLQRLAAQDPLPEDFRDDLTEGLGVISSRADALNRFVRAYATLARMPEPSPATVSVPDWVRRVVSLETRVSVAVESDDDVTVEADPDQLDQLLINLVRNAADAAKGTGGTVEVAWSAGHTMLELTIRDTGPGLPHSANLFVPFFTTKPGGSGIGLVLCRQVAEGHGGTVQLSDRQDRSGCVATVRLPIRFGGR